MCELFTDCDGVKPRTGGTVQQRGQPPPTTDHRQPMYDCIWSLPVEKGLEMSVKILDISIRDGMIIWKCFTYCIKQSTKEFFFNIAYQLSLRVKSVFQFIHFSYSYLHSHSPHHRQTNHTGVQITDYIICLELSGS